MAKLTTLKNDDLEWLKDFGVQSIRLENPCNSLAITGDEFEALRVNDEQYFSLELNLGATDIKRLQDALSKEARKPEDELKHELNVMHAVNECEGRTINEKIDKYFEKVDGKAKVCKAKNKVTTTRYKIKHR